MLHYGLEHEMVIKPIDYLLRRSSQLLFDSEHAKAVKELIVDEMAEYYDWDEAVRAEYLDEVEQQLTASTTFN